MAAVRHALLDRADLPAAVAELVNHVPGHGAAGTCVGIADDLLDRRRGRAPCGGRPEWSGAQPRPAWATRSHEHGPTAASAVSNKLIWLRR